MPVPFVWTRSPGRMIPLWNYAGAAPAERQPRALPLRWAEKAEDETKDYSIDASALLAGAGDSLAAVIGGSGHLTVICTAISSGIVTLWLGGGQAGVDEGVDIVLTTESGRRVHRIVRLQVLP